MFDAHRCREQPKFVCRVGETEVEPGSDNGEVFCLTYYLRMVCCSNALCIMKSALKFEGKKVKWRGWEFCVK